MLLFTLKIKIDKKKAIGINEPCYIILDVGANHNCDLNVAKELIVKAAEVGADAVKFQTYTAENLYSTKTPKFSKDLMLPVDLIKKHQHPRAWLPILNDTAKENNITFISSPFDYEAVDLLEKINVPFYKIASPEIVDLELVEFIAKKNKPIIFSTGMSNLGDIENTINVIRNYHSKIIILHCSTLYPTPFESVNLRALKTLRNAFKLPVGYSDHTLGIHISLAALAMGAVVIERHFTLDNKQEGPDHPFAQEPYDIKLMIKQIREIELARGDGIKKPDPKELEEVFGKARRSIIAAKGIPKGTLIEKESLVVKRPGFGIAPKFIDIVIGREAKVNIEKDQWITWEMI